MITPQKIVDVLMYLEVIDAPDEIERVVSVEITAEAVLVKRMKVSQDVYEVEDGEDEDQDEPVSADPLGGDLRPF